MSTARGYVILGFECYETIKNYISKIRVPCKCDGKGEGGKEKFCPKCGK